MINYKKQFIFLLIITFLASITLSWYAYKLRNQIFDKETQIISLTDTVTYYKTKQGFSGATKKIYVGTKGEIINQFKDDKDTYQTLKQSPNIKTYTEFTTVTRLDTVVVADTVYVTKDSVGRIDFNLKKRIVEPHGYYRARIRIHNDSVKLKVQMFDKFKIKSEEKSNGFFKPKSYVINVENSNPYVKIDSLKSFEIKPKNKLKHGLKVAGLVAIAIGSFLLLHK